MTYGLGVDLGTTYTAAAVRADGRVEVAQLGVRRPEIPTLVFVPASGPVLVGEPAERRGTEEPARLAREFKRRVGDPVAVLVGGAPYSAHALMARVLEHVLQTVSGQREGPPEAVTVTHPANWGPYKRELLQQAARLAEVDSLALRPEPEAAAVQYAAGERVRDGEIVAVYDLGGGTFDAAVLRKTTAGFELLGQPEGIEQLGGVDFDDAVFGYVSTVLAAHLDKLDPGDEAVTAALARLRRDCVEAKEALSGDTEVMIPVALPGLHTRVRLNRHEFEEMIQPALSDTVAAMRRALRSAEVPPERLRTILLAGGSSRIPLVSQLLTTAFDRPTVLDPYPEHSIALGAARTTGPAAAWPDASGPTAPPKATVPPEQTAPPGHTAPPPEPAPEPAPKPVPVPVELSAADRPAGPPVEPRRRLPTRLLLMLLVPLILLGIVGLALIWPDRGTPGGTTEEPAGNTAAGCGFADEFTGETVDDRWEQVREEGGFVVAGGTVELNAPDGSDIYEDELRAPMMLRTATGDFVIETDVTAGPAQFYQGAGLVLWNGSQQYVRLERGFGDVGAIVFEFKNGDQHVKVRPPHSVSPDVVATDAERVVLQLRKTADAVSAHWRPFDQPDFEDLGSIDVALPDSTKAGVAVLNRAQNGAVPTTFTARFEYVRLTC